MKHIKIAADHEGPLGFWARFVAWWRAYVALTRASLHDDTSHRDLS